MTTTASKGARPARCCQCGYNLTGLDLRTQCPECGWTIDWQKAAKEQCNRRLCAVLLGTAAVALIAETWWAVHPSWAKLAIIGTDPVSGITMLPPGRQIYIAMFILQHLGIVATVCLVITNSRPMPKVRRTVSALVPFCILCAVAGPLMHFGGFPPRGARTETHWALGLYCVVAYSLVWRDYRKEWALSE